MQSAEVTLRGRKIVGGLASGEALVTTQAISFLGGVDPSSGRVVERGHELYGEFLGDTILVFPSGKGSTVGSYVIYRMKKLGTAPAAIVNRETEAIIATGCVIAGIPLVDKLERDPLEAIEDGMLLRVRADEGVVEVAG